MAHEYDLTEQSDLDMLDEVDGEYYNWDQNQQCLLFANRGRIYGEAE